MKSADFRAKLKAEAEEEQNDLAQKASTLLKEPIKTAAASLGLNPDDYEEDSDEVDEDDTLEEALSYLRCAVKAFNEIIEELYHSPYQAVSTAKEIAIEHLTMEIEKFIQRATDEEAEILSVDDFVEYATKGEAKIASDPGFLEGES